MAVVSSRNLFIDSSTSVEGEGDSFTLHLGGHSIAAGDGQILRLSLVNFSMANNLYTVNDSNNRIEATTTFASASYPTTLRFRLPSRNFTNLRGMANSFYEEIRDQLLQEVRNQANNQTITCRIEGINSTDPGPSDGTKLLSCKLIFSAAHNITDLLFRLIGGVTDSYILLGGDRFHPSRELENAFTVNISSTTEITIEGKYPMQLNTLPQVYLRVDTPSTNLETSSLAGVSHSTDHVINSNILAVVEMQDNFIFYQSNNNEYFLDLQQKQLSHIKFSITDRSNRRLSQAGPGDKQSSFGNMFFAACVRIDVIQKTHPQYLESKPQPLPNLKNSTFNFYLFLIKINYFIIKMS